MLTERQYLGEGYVHAFRNDTTGELKYVPCTQKEYDELQTSSWRPTLEGHTRLYSMGGTIKVDTLDTMLGDNEYCVTPEKVVIKERNKVEEITTQEALTVKLAQLEEM